MGAIESMLIIMSQDFFTNWNTVFLVLYRSLAPMRVPPFEVLTLIAIDATRVMAAAAMVIIDIAMPMVSGKIFDSFSEGMAGVDVGVTVAEMESESLRGVVKGVTFCKFATVDWEDMSSDGVLSLREVTVGSW